MSSNVDLKLLQEPGSFNGSAAAWGDFKLNVEYYVGVYEPKIQEIMDKSRQDLDKNWWLKNSDLSEEEHKASVQLACIVGTRLKGQVRDKVHLAGKLE